MADDIRAPASGSSGEPAERSGSPELPPLRIRGSLAARIVALVLLVVLGTGVSAVIILNQVRGLRANFDLLTGVYVPFQTELAQAQTQSHQIATFVAGFGNPEVQLDHTDMVNLEEAIDRRVNELAEARLPLTQAIDHSDRIGGDEQLEQIYVFAALLDELEALVQEGVDPNEVLANASRQSEIGRRFRELQKLADEEVARQRITVAQAGREAEQRAVIVTIVAAVFSLLATLAVILTLRPLRRLADSVRRIGGGDWSSRIEVGDRPERDDEATRLAREVNLMAAALEERERRLLHGERLAAIGRLAAQITHEIRNPLSSVALNAELLEDELEEFGEASQEACLLLARISNEVDRLTQITEAYLGFARRPAPQLAKVDLVAELADLLDFLAHEHERDRIRVVRELPSEPVWVEADAGQLRQAFINLLRNAQEALLELGDRRESSESALGDLLDDFDSPALGEPTGEADDERPTLRVKLARKDDHASVLVSDTGPGIRLAEAHASSSGSGFERIFDAFVTSKTHGTGLGLPMVQQVALDHGGSVRLVETGPAGTTFEFSLPACDPPGPSVSSPNSA